MDTLSNEENQLFLNLLKTGYNLKQIKGYSQLTVRKPYQTTRNFFQEKKQVSKINPKKYVYDSEHSNIVIK